MNSQLSQGGSVDGISELLKCYICFNKLQDTCICPNCGKIACYTCIQRWIKYEKPNCPMCRIPLAPSDLIRVGLFDDLIEHVDSIRKKKVTENKQEFCSVHPTEELKVYCETCRQCTCFKCGLWGQHKGHMQTPLEEMCRLRKETFNSDVSKLNEMLKETMTYMERVERKIESVRGERQKAQGDIETVVSEIQGRLDDQLQQKLQRLGESRRHLKHQAYEISSVSTEVEGKLSGPMSELATQSVEMEQKLSRLLQKLEQNKRSESECVPDVGSFTNEVIPSFYTNFFKITSFMAHKNRGTEIYSDSPLKFCGMSWRLKVYPNGTDQHTGTHLGVFVELTEGHNTTSHYQYCVELIHRADEANASGNSNFKREYASDFSVGECWGYKKFFDLSKLTSGNFLVNDTLLLKLSIRQPTFHQQCKDMQLYITALEKKLISLNQQLKKAQRGERSSLQTVPTTPAQTSPSHTRSSSTPANTPSTTSQQTQPSVPAPTIAVATTERQARQHEFTRSAQQQHFRRERVSRTRSECRSQRNLSTARIPMQQPISMSQQRSTSSLMVPGAWGENYFQRQDGFRHGGEMDHPSLREQRRRSYDPTMLRRHPMDHMPHPQPQVYQYTAQSMSQDPHYMREQQHAHHSSMGMLVPDSSRGFDESGSQNSPGTHLFSEEECEQGIKAAGNLGIHCSQAQYNSQIEMSQEFEDSFHNTDFLSPKTLTEEDYSFHQQKLYAMSQEIESQHELTPSNHQPHPARVGSTQQFSPPQAAKLTKSRVYRSLNDISVSNSPIAEATSLHTLQEEPRNSQGGFVHGGGLRMPVMNQRKAFHRSQGAINTMGNDHKPGLKSSVVAALSMNVPHQQYHSQNFYHSSSRMQQRSRVQQHQKQTMSQQTASAASQGNPHNLHQIQRQKQEPQLQPHQESKQQKQPPRTEEVQQEQSLLRGSGRRYGKLKAGKTTPIATTTASSNNTQMTQPSDTQTTCSADSAPRSTDQQRSVGAMGSNTSLSQIL